MVRIHVPQPNFRPDSPAQGTHPHEGIEGVAGISNWEEADKTHATYPEFREEMTAEVVAACEGAMAAGASEILIKDAHGTGRNIIAARLPECARLVRG